MTPIRIRVLTVVFALALMVLSAIPVSASPGDGGWLPAPTSVPGDGAWE